MGSIRGSNALPRPKTSIPSTLSLIASARPPRVSSTVNVRKRESCSAREKRSDASIRPSSSRTALADAARFMPTRILQRWTNGKDVNDSKEQFTVNLLQATSATIPLAAPWITGTKEPRENVTNHQVLLGRSRRLVVRLCRDGAGGPTHHPSGRRF